MTDEKGTRMAGKTNACCLWRVRGKEKAPVPQQAKGMTAEKGTRMAGKTNACCLWRVRGKEKAPGPQQAKGMTDEKGQRLFPLASQRETKKPPALDEPEA